MLYIMSHIWRGLVAGVQLSVPRELHPSDYSSSSGTDPLFQFSSVILVKTSTVLGISC